MKTLWLLGGLGMGAGLMYVLDPEKGEARRDMINGQLAAYGRQTGDLLETPRGRWAGRPRRPSPRPACRSDISQVVGSDYLRRLCRRECPLAYASWVVSVWGQG
jgi:hypothetical protein